MNSEELQETIITQIVSKRVNDINECMYNFLENNGYKDVRKMKIDELEELFEKLREEDKQLRYELFYKHMSSEMNSIKNEYAIIPFFDSYSCPIISRVEVYKMCKLDKKGYIL